MKRKIISYFVAISILICFFSNAYALNTSERLERAKVKFLELCKIVEKNNVYECGCLADLYVDLPVHKVKIIKRDMFMDQTELSSYRNKIVAEKSQKTLDRLDAFCDLSFKERKLTENIQDYIGQNSGILYHQYCKVRNTINKTKDGTVKIVNPNNAMPSLIKINEIASCVKKDFLDEILSDEKSKCIKKTSSVLSGISEKKVKNIYLLGNKSAEELCSCMEKNHKDAILTNYANIKYNSNFNSNLDNDNRNKCTKIDLSPDL